jgi:hypothetical protein
MPSEERHRAIFIVAFAATLSCGDPVRDELVAALGAEDPRVSPGPEHRPGQPCLLCHHDGGEASSFALAGTVYLERDTSKPAGQVAVLVVDASSAKFESITNCAGNFFVRPEQYPLQYPIWIGLRAGTVRREMDSAVYREGSCAGCHGDPVGSSSPGHVFLIDDPMLEKPPQSPCGTEHSQ